MASIPQKNIFSWEKIETSSDLDRLRMVLSSLPDEALMVAIENARGHGRNKYPVRPMWNSVIAGVVFQHVSIESLRRELQRNGELRDLCGFNPMSGSEAVPPSWVYTRFLQILMNNMSHLETIFTTLISELEELLPDLGSRLAGDSKALASAGRPNDKERDGRRETDADYGTKTYKGKREDGSLWKKVTRWFGFKLHLIVDANYELPLAYHVTRASTSDTTNILPLLASLKEKHPSIVERADSLSLDRGYDSENNNKVLYDTYGITPLIDIRHQWKDGEKTRAINPEKLDRIIYDEDGTVYCVHRSCDDARKSETTPLCFDGFEATRETLKYRCPAAVYGYECPERNSCGESSYGRVVRIPLKLNRRLFVPVPRNTAKWERLYAQRSSVERVNGRLDQNFMFELHYIRGLSKMKLRISIALIIMLALAYGAIKAGAKQNMRSLVKKLPNARAA